MNISFYDISAYPLAHSDLSLDRAKKREFFFATFRRYNRGRDYPGEFVSSFFIFSIRISSYVPAPMKALQLWRTGHDSHH